jgi:phosphotriesterase-related protein
MFVKDIRDGIAGTGETGAPITVHTNAAHQTGRLALEFYAEEGVDLTKVVIGHAGDTDDRIVLGHDASCYIDYFSGTESQQILQTAAPNWHYRHISEDVLPMLRELGVTEDQITTMLVDNPRRYFS